jgi:hypothetical protein
MHDRAVELTELDYLSISRAMLLHITYLITIALNGFFQNLVSL